MKKRLWSILLTACLLMGLLPTAALAAGNVSYLDVEGKTQTCETATDVTSGSTTWPNGWYVVQGSVTITGGVTVTGDVYLILADGCTLTVEGGIQGEGNLTIYGQSGGTGQLIVNGSNNGGSSYGIKVNNLAINGGSVTAAGGTVVNEDGSPTGASYGIYASSIAISGGHVIAKASAGSALNARPNLPAAYWWRTEAAGSFTDAAGEEIEIPYTGSYLEIRSIYTVTLNANGGVCGTASLTTNENGKVASLPTASRENYTFDGWYTAAGGGAQVTTDTVFNANTTIYAHWTSNGDAAPIYSIGLDVSDTHTFDPADVGYGAQTSKTVTVSNTGTGATGALSVALSGANADAFTVSKASINSIAPGGTDSFTVVPNTGLSAGTYTATVAVDGASVDAKTFVVSFTVNAPVVVVPDNYVFDVAEGTIRILDGDAAGTVKVAYGDGQFTPDFDPSQEITVTGSFVISSATNYIGKSLKVETGLPVKIRIKNLTINNHEPKGLSDTDGYQAMVLLGSETTGKANVTLTLEGTNYLGGGIACGGIEVGEGHTLTIRGNGSLTAQGYSEPNIRSGAGIGGHMKSNCGTVNIESGTITAIGGFGSPGIGGGYAKESVGGNGGTVNISGGKVTATGGEGGAGIGGGSNQYGIVGHGLGGNVTITGGTVTATAGSDKADAIGGGRDLTGEAKGTGTLTVNGNAWVGWTGTTSTAKTLTQGVVLGVVYGNVTLTEDRTLTSGFGVLSIHENASLTIPNRNDCQVPLSDSGNLRCTTPTPSDGREIYEQNKYNN